MTVPDPDTLVYAGVGSRATPQNVLDDMSTMAGWLSRTGWHLSSGGADGADTAFAQGAPPDQRTQYLPWKDYNHHAGPDCVLPKPSDMAACMKVAEQHHPTWHRCSDGARKLHARNAAIMLGPSLDRPVKAVVCWTPGGEIKGGTGMALRIAAHYDIPVLNLATVSPRKACEQLLEMRNKHQAQSRNRDLTSDTPASTQTQGTAENRPQPAQKNDPDHLHVEYRTPSIVNLRDNPDAVQNGAIRIDRQTEWGNPFTIGEHGSREDVIALYQEDLWKRIKSEDLSLDQLAALDGKTLACTPDDCHGEVLSRAATWAAARLELQNSQTVSESSADPRAHASTDSQLAADANVPDDQRLARHWNDDCAGIQDDPSLRPYFLERFQEYVRRAQDIHESYNSNDVPHDRRVPQIAEILEYNDDCKTALSDIHEFCNNADRSIRRLADLKESTPSYHLSLPELDPHMWLHTALWLRHEGETMLFAEDVHYDTFLHHDPKLWQDVHDKLLAITRGCADAGADNTDYLKHHDLYLPPLPSAPAHSQEQREAITEYSQLRYEWHEHIHQAEHNDLYAFHLPYEKADSWSRNDLFGDIKTMSANPLLPDEITDRLRTISHNQFDYQRTRNDISQFHDDAFNALQTHQQYIDTIKRPTTPETHFDDIDGFYSWQKNTDRLADKADSITDSDQPERALYLKMNPDDAKRVNETIEKLRAAAWDTQFDTPRHQIANQRDANEHETPKRSMSM